MSEIDPTQMSDEDLEAALEASVNDVPAEAVETLSEEVAQEETPDEQPAEEPVAEDAPAEDSEAVDESETETESKEEPQLSEMDVLKATIEELEARAKKWESVAGKHAGELGFLKQQARQFQTQQASAIQRAIQPDDDDSLLDEQPQTQPPPAPQQPPSNTGLSTWAVAQAVKEAGAQFVQGHPDMSEMAEEVKSYIESSGYDQASLLTMDDPIAAAKETTRLLDEAYYHVSAERASARKAEIQALVAEQTKRASKAKAKAAVSGSSSTPPPKPQSKTVNEMTDEELEKAMVEATGGKW